MDDGDDGHVVFRPVLDPELPEKGREILASSPEVLAAASAAAPGKPPWEHGAMANLISAVFAGAGFGFVPLLVWLVAGLEMFLTVAIALGALVAVVGFAMLRVENPHRLARKHHGRYYLADDFDEESLGYIERARAAIAAISGSEIGRAGLLDDVANAVTLPRQEWEIARTCAELTRVKRQIEKVRSKHASLTKVIEPQRRALETAAEATERRIAALERYADRTKAADAQYREWEAFKEIEEIEADVRELLAQTAQDDLAVAEIDRLSADTPLAELQRAVAEAKDAGLALAVDAEEPA
ncbi:hypothetical protein [Actinomadura chokoriensis]|uniref:hypothetical protein n=1 Tax=Actinomadura chokoriensis TaxID=454156 RepID=UPI0031F818F7